MGLNQAPVPHVSDSVRCVVTSKLVTRREQCSLVDVTLLERTYTGMLSVGTHRPGQYCIQPPPHRAWMGGC